MDNSTSDAGAGHTRVKHYAIAVGRGIVLVPGTTVGGEDGEWLADGGLEGADSVVTRYDMVEEKCHQLGVGELGLIWHPHRLEWLIVGMARWRR